MSVVIKTVGSRKYAYLAYRSGKKVVQKYLGAASSPAVAAKLKKLEAEKKVPKRFYFLFWDVEPAELNLQRYARYIIERVLEAGGLDAFLWIQNIYPTNLIAEICLTGRKISRKSKNFWSIWLNLEQEESGCAS